MRRRWVGVFLSGVLLSLPCVGADWRDVFPRAQRIFAASPSYFREEPKTMRYMLRKKLFSMGSDFTIKDETGQDRFFVDGKVLTLRDQLSFQDMAGNELATVQKKLLAWGPTYEIYHAGTLVATVKESLFTLLGHRFSVHDEAGTAQPGAGDLGAEGNFTNHQYTFSRAGREVARVSEQWFSVVDTYGVEIADGEDDVLILACAVVIERCQEAAGSRLNVGATFS